MSRIRNQIALHEDNRAAHRRAVQRVTELWADRVEYRLERDVFDRIDNEDRLYARALHVLDAEFDRAAKLLDTRA